MTKAIYINEAAFVDGVVTGATNLGTGNGTIFTTLNNDCIQLKTLSGGTNITLTCNGNYIGINSIGGVSCRENITKLINQASHGFVVGNVIGWSGGTYNKAIANGNYDGEVIGVVSKCYDANCFDLTQSGYVTGLTSLSTNATYFLSPTTAGALSSSEPTVAGQVNKSVLIADSSTSGWVLPYPGYIVTTGTTGGSSVCEFTVCGNGSATGFTVQHDLNKQFVVVEIVQTSSPYATVYTAIQRPNANCVYVLFDTAPPTGTCYKVLITG